MTDEKARIQLEAHKKLKDATKQFNLKFEEKFPNWKAEISRAAAYDTFTTKLGKENQGGLGTFAAFLDGFAKQHRWAEFLLPFRKVGTNIAFQTYERTPLPLFMGSEANLLKLLSDVRGKSISDTDAVTRAALGTTMMLLFAAAAKAGVITGSGPSDKDKNENWEKSGKQANSFRFGNTWVSYDRFEPASSLISAAANLVESQEETGKDKVSKVVSAFNDAMVDKTYLSTLSNVMDAVRDPSRYGKSAVKNLVGSVVPNIVRKFAQATDLDEQDRPIIRDTSSDSIMGSVINKVQEGIPGLSRLLPPQATGMGEVKTRPGGRLGPLNPLGFVRVSDAAPENREFESLLNRLDWVPGRPDKTIEINGVKIPVSASDMAIYDRVDQVVTEKLRGLATSPKFLALPLREQKKFLESEYTKARNNVRNSLKLKYSQKTSSSQSGLQAGL